MGAIVCLHFEMDENNEEWVPESGKGKPCVTKGNRQIPGKGVMAEQYTTPLPDIIPSSLTFSGWRNDQLDAFFEIPEASRTNKSERIKWIKSQKLKPINMGQAHDQAMIISATMSKAVLATARQDNNKVWTKVVETMDRVVQLEDKADCWEKSQRIDKTSQKEIIIYNKSTFDSVDEKEQEPARKAIFNIIKPLSKELLSWKDVRKVRKIGQGKRARLAAELVSNHQRERVICSWNDDPTVVKNYKDFVILPSKPIYDQWVGQKLYMTHVECERMNLNSDGDLFYLVEKLPKERHKQIVAYQREDPKVASLLEAWENRQKAPQTPSAEGEPQP